ncbi:pentatricopeptide repeat-containing protein At4g21065-like [Chenopodium quinoa]|uniref:pentatricopeptide repeat-containing protein At4g21065-like n=1 Tax=Chenopodium quinoa TaxID=63459 RepID=UPI000B793BC4|nr:pentatricopeptide repeat-containing protein At4g21065-like [Chenopodium quinoa]
MQCTLIRSKFFCCSVALMSNCLNPLKTLISSNSTQIEITQKQIQRFHASLSSKQHEKQPQLLGFIDDLKDERTLHTLHGRVIKSGSIVDLNVGNYVLSLYAKFKDLGSAQNLFDEMSERNVRTWTVLISGFARIGLFQVGLDFLLRMLVEGVCPNGFTLSSAFKCCSSIGLVYNGKAIHGWILKHGIGLDAVLKNSVIDFYVKSEELDYANKLFDSTDCGDTVSCNIMIGANMKSGNVESSLDMFRRLSTKDTATWNTIISGMMRNGFERTALELLYEMVKEQACLDEFTYAIALALVSSLSILGLGAQLHARLIRLRFYDNEYIRTSLIDMYSKCGVIDKASVVFKQMPQCFSNKHVSKINGENLKMDTVSWSSMLSGYAQNGRFGEALEMFCHMVREGIGVDKYTLTTIVSVCADYGFLEFGEQIHGLTHKVGHKFDLVLCSSLVDMYSKCGSLGNAQTVFDQTVTRNTILWTAIINGYAFHGLGREAVRLFQMMLEDDVQPNEITFVAVLTACSHAGLVDEGRDFFSVMKEVYKIKPGVEHFTCMVDLFGRAGYLDEIKNFIYENNLSHLSSVWRAFLSSCRLHKSYDMGKWVSEKLLELEPLDAEPYVLLSNMCATSNRWEESARVRSSMLKKGVRKHPGQSWIQLNNQVHTFVMGDRSHPQEADIYSYLDNLIGRLKEIGYCTNLEQVTQDVEEEQQEMFLRCHSEKLAVVYGIISTTNVTPIRVMKNLRVCTDCHNFLKYTSQLLGREIIVRDIRRFHHFKDGHCSCGDYW